MNEGPRREDLPPVAISEMDQLRALARDTLEQGCCFSCGEHIPMDDWPPVNGTELPDGWALYTSCGDDEESAMLMCPVCEERDDRLDGEDDE